ncbi:galactitol-1-phosphate 5-dehydrogenase [Thalassobacillus sp. CUG 92003]|uniref:galactitol-1-phosphate 5-dehydrogenase n=1 Tax=Thalassobacillus sp. CUG 92003 TaxID=2736641 RepID=UPI0015E74FF7|nr:galactitol-1-phosphate 5-dehydrogenase [Thalassobacillus sp. CUG 92003]
MKSLKLYDIKVLRHEQADPPHLTDEDDVIIKVKAAGICGSDLSRYAKLGPYVEGMIFGHEFAGEVESTGGGVSHVKPGDRVVGCPALYCGMCESCRKGKPAQCEALTVIGAKQPGSYAEYVKLPAENVVLVPDEVDDDHAALVEPSSVALHGLYRTRLEPGSRVAVLGCGNIGLLTVQWAKIFGAETVYAIDIDDQKLAIAQTMGADVMVNPQTSSLYEAFMDASSGEGVDVAVESAGSPVTSAEVFSLAKKGGQVVFMGIPYGDIAIERFYFERIVRNELEVLGAWNAVSAPFPGKEWHTTLQMMKCGKLNVEPMITHRRPLEEGPDLFDAILAKQETYGKVLLHP